ncbi:MAG: helix-turn-helix domain-containing protein [Flammeovirgaceae bacterium]
MNTAAIKKYWMIHNPHPVRSRATGTLIADGYIELILVEGQVIIQLNDHAETYYSGVYLIGQLQGKAALILAPQTKVHFFKLHAWANGMVTVVPFVELTNQVIALADINPSLASTIKEVHVISTIPSLMHFINTKLHTSSHNASTSLFIKEATQRLMIQNLEFGNVKKQLLTEFRISAKTMETKFKQHIGLTPKQFSLKVNLRKAVENMIYNPSHESLTELALSSGFYDQSHFIRSFKTVFHTVPSQFQAKSYFIPNSKEELRFYTI